jgi:hypothetical protein
MAVLSPRGIGEDQHTSSGRAHCIPATESSAQVQEDAHPVVVGLGDPVTDIVVRVTHRELAGLADEAGGSEVIGHLECKQLRAKLAAMGRSQSRKQGGSAANVIRCVSQLSSGLACRCAACPLASMHIWQRPGLTHNNVGGQRTQEDGSLSTPHRLWTRCLCEARATRSVLPAPARRPPVQSHVVDRPSWQRCA